MVENSTKKRGNFSAGLNPWLMIVPIKWQCSCKQGMKECGKRDKGYSFPSSSCESLDGFSCITQLCQYLCREHIIESFWCFFFHCLYVTTVMMGNLRTETAGDYFIYGNVISSSLLMASVWVNAWPVQLSGKKRFKWLSRWVSELKMNV